MTDTTTCGEARRLLWPDGGPRKTTEAVIRAREHTAGCEACRQFLADMRTLAEGIRRASAGPAAPPDVRDRLFNAVARARVAVPPPGTRRRVWIWAVAVGVAAVLGLVVGAQSLRVRQPDGAIASFAEDHLRAVKGEGITSSDSLMVARWLSSRLPMPVEVPLFPGATLRGGRLCLMGPDRGAVVEYDLNDRTLSYFVVPVHPTEPQRAGPPHLRHGSYRGYRVVAWQDAGLTHALVADLPETELTELARYCMQQMMALIRRTVTDV